MQLHAIVRFQSKKLAVVAGVSPLIFASPAVVYAQQTQPANQPPSAAASPTPTPRPSTEAATAERVVVTAEKREENIQEVPSSISVINDAEIDNLHATQLTDYAGYIPGLSVQSIGTPGKTTISLRGLSPLSSGATTATYIDEIPVGSSGIYQAASQLELDLLPYDIRRVEILRGPQGTLYGANSLGGLVKYVTLEPNLSTEEFRFGGGVSGVENGDDPGWDVHIGANLPLASNHLALRASYARNEIPGFIDNVVNGENSINSGNQQGALLSALYRPIDTLTIRLTALGQRIESDNNAIVSLDPTTLDPVFGDLKNQVFVNEPFKKKIGLIAGTVNADLGFADLTSATAYSNTTTFNRADVTVSFGMFPLLLGVPVTGISFFDTDLNLDKFTQELRLTSKPDGRFLWQLGGFYTYERGNNTQRIFLRQPDGTLFTGPLAVLNTLTIAAIPSRYTEYAGFANASYRFVDWFGVRAGLRFSRNEQTFRQVVYKGLLLPLGNTPGGSREDVFDYMVSPEFKVYKDVLLYARVATGYQPGGPNVVAAGVPPSVDATTDTSYEVGLKSEFFDHHLLFNIAGYHIELEDIQVLSSANNFVFALNGGKATSNGVEFTLGYQPIKGLSFAVNGSYTDATLDNDAPQLNGRAGDRLPFIPEFSASATVDYYFPLWGAHNEPVAVAGTGGKEGKTIASPPAKSEGWTGHVGAGVRFVGDELSNVESSPTAYKIDSYAALDLNADISNGRYTIRVFARNVTDERIYQTIAPVTNAVTGALDHLQGVPIQPRTVGVEFDVRF